MSFIIDKQTLDDLNIFGKRGKDSIFSIFNRTATRGGAEQLEAWFRNALSDETAIRHRIAIIRFFRESNARFIFKSTLFDAASLYLNLSEGRAGLEPNSRLLERKWRQWMNTDMDYRTISKGIICLVQLLQDLKAWLNQLPSQLPAAHPLLQEIRAMQELMGIPEWSVLFEHSSRKPSYRLQVDFDKLLRFRHKERLIMLLQRVYSLDVFIAVAQVAATNKFVFPEVLEQDAHALHLENCWHPELKKPVPNSISMTPAGSIIFLTGANMAGKSTFMKSIGIALFLAHMGFPVPAENMRFSVRDGMLTTINLPDNLDMGYSHFYVEVLRVKKVATLLARKKNMFIMFDELFRGTNVKDAYEGTVAITGAFAQKPNCQFIVSTHIMEAGEVLREQHSNISFRFLPTKLEANTPVYTRKLENGISADRHGMIIIQNEGILDMLTKQSS